MITGGCTLDIIAIECGIACYGVLGSSCECSGIGIIAVDADPG